MPIHDEAILGTAIIIAAMQSDPEVAALKAESDAMEAKLKAISVTMPKCW